MLQLGREERGKEMYPASDGSPPRPQRRGGEQRTTAGTGVRDLVIPQETWVSQAGSHMYHIHSESLVWLLRAPTPCRSRRIRKRILDLLLTSCSLTLRAEDRRAVEYHVNQLEQLLYLRLHPQTKDDRVPQYFGQKQSSVCCP